MVTGVAKKSAEKPVTDSYAGFPPSHCPKDETPSHGLTGGGHILTLVERVEKQQVSAEAADA